MGKVWVGEGLELEELVAEGAEGDVEGSRGRWAEGEGLGEEGVEWGGFPLLAPVF